MKNRNNKIRILRKITLIFTCTILFGMLALALTSRIKGVGIRVPDGRYLGYSNATSEWLFLEFPNIPVRHDGPYVLNEDNGRYAIYINGDGTNPSKAIQEKVKNRIEVRVDNEHGTKFNVPLRNNHPRSQLKIPSPERLIAISDLEGEFDALVNILKTNNVIDDSLKWSYGAGHLVLIGDMVDRGDNVVPLLWLLYKLEAEAKIAGGDLHYVLGNHERYLLDGRTKSVANKYYGTFRASGMSQQELYAESSELGRWLRSKPIMLKIGNTLFAHGGISPMVLSKNPTLESIDKEAKETFVLGGVIRRTIDGSIIHGSTGIIFYRGLAKDMTEHNLGKKADNSHVEEILTVFEADNIAIGHTLAEHIGLDYNGKVIRVDVHHSAGLSEALLIEDDLMWRVDLLGNKFPLGQVKNISD
ncbi:metallophosphoesterase [Ekhidna sp. To15]|uniref:metallophosphoesterase n=1 Tax=Ekhidna sp. To15 TaxID=3395267 RepID=UPI003F521EF5